MKSSPSAARIRSLVAKFFVVACLGCESPVPESLISPGVALAREEVARAYAVAVLKEVSRKAIGERVPIEELDLDSATLREATDTRERAYAFVSFRRREESQSGFYVVLEFCGRRAGAYSPRQAEYSEDLEAALRDFLAIMRDPERTFLGECKWWVP